MDVDNIQNATDSEFGEAEIYDLLSFFSHETYHVPNSLNQPRSYMADAMKLMERDYIIEKIDNKDGNLCPQYPEIIPIIESPRIVTTIYENEEETMASNLDVTELKTLFEEAKLARCRQRFPVPVILINGKYVCRSSTLASEAEMCYRTGLANVPGYELLRSVKEFWWPIEGLGPNPEVQEDDPTEPGPYDNDVRAQTICDRLRSLDIKLLKRLNVNTIVDIMVEKRKVKHSLYVSASEKVDAARYSFFKLISLPYPGCEFFKDYHDANFNGENLKYKWDHPANDAELLIPADHIKKNLSMSWEQYKDWDLIRITQNYIKYILKRLQEDNSGLLLHCISGWDRTPLFISLLRLSLWADYLIHPTLNEYEILYFTLAYDWYLFGHHLSNRLYKREEIMAFCFDFLRYITTDEYSAKGNKKKQSDESRSPSSHSSSAEDNQYKKSKHTNGDELMAEPNENSNDSTIMPIEVAFEDRSSPCEDPLNSISRNSSGSLVSLVEDDPMDSQNSDDTSKNKILSPSSGSNRRTSPIPVGGSGRRQRSESTGSNSSNISSTWQMISDCGSVERDIGYKPMRLQRLEKVRTIFNSCYQKRVKSASFGPPSKWFLEECYENLPEWSTWATWFGFNTSEAENGKNGNFEKNGTGRTIEKNGNTTQNKAAADSANSNK